MIILLCSVSSIVWRLLGVGRGLTRRRLMRRLRKKVRRTNRTNLPTTKRPNIPVWSNAGLDQKSTVSCTYNLEKKIELPSKKDVLILSGRS